MRQMTKSVECASNDENVEGRSSKSVYTFVNIKNASHCDRKKERKINFVNSDWSMESKYPPLSSHAYKLFSCTR